MANTREFDEGRTDSFIKWMTLVDDALSQVCGLTSDDLPDIDYWDRWEAGQGPKTAARAALKEAM